MHLIPPRFHFASPLAIFCAARGHLKSLGLAALLTCLPFAVHADDLKLTFAVTTETTKPAPSTGGSATSSKQQSTVTVTLGSDYFVRTDESASAYYDFAQRRIYTLAPVDSFFINTSLYAGVSARKAELQNRLMIAKALAAGGVKNGLVAAPVFIESLFSLRSPGSPSPTASVESKRTTYTHAAKPLASFTHDGFVLTETESVKFARFLRHSFDTHPEIITALQQRRIVPQQLEEYRYELDDKHLVITLTKAERIPQSASVAKFLAGKTERPAASAELLTATTLRSSDYKKACEASREKAIAAAQAKNYFDALLLFLEYTLSTGEPLPKEFATYKAAIEADPDCHKFFTSQRPTSKAEAAGAVETLRSLEAKATTGRPVLLILRANLLTSLGKQDEALELFHTALKASPAILGAWRDLGFIYHSGYRMDLSWQWWDALRKVSPSVPFARSIDDLERKLANEHPEFF